MNLLIPSEAGSFLTNWVTVSRSMRTALWRLVGGWVVDWFVSHLSGTHRQEWICVRKLMKNTMTLLFRTRPSRLHQLSVREPPTKSPFPLALSPSEVEGESEQNETCADLDILQLLLWLRRTVIIGKMWQVLRSLKGAGAVRTTEHRMIWDDNHEW
jgi:hypothetical protein